MTSFGLFAFCTTLKKLNTLMANLLLDEHIGSLALSPGHSQFSMLHAGKQEILVREVTCARFSSKGGGRVIIVRGCFLVGEHAV